MARRIKQEEITVTETADYTGQTETTGVVLADGVSYRKGPGRASATPQLVAAGDPVTTALFGAVNAAQAKVDKATAKLVAAREEASQGLDLIVAELNRRGFNADGTAFTA